MKHRSLVASHSLLALASLLLVAAPAVRAQAIREVAPGVTRIDAPPDASASFGRALAVRGSLAVVGSSDEPHRAGASTRYAGAVHLLRHDGTVWRVEARLTAWDDTTGYSHFGRAVDVTGADGAETIAIGAPASFAYNAPDKPGRVYLFRREAGQWRPDTVLAGFGPGDWFGESLSLDGTRLAVGQYGGYGTVYVFDRTGEAWERTFRYDGPSFYDRLGDHVSVSGDLLLIKSRTPEYDEGYSHVLRRDAGGAWRRDVRLDSLVRVVRSGARMGASWLYGNRLYTVTGKSGELQGHPLVLIRDETGWRVEADLFDPELHYSLDRDFGNPFEGEHVVVASAYNTASAPRFRPASVYRRSGTRWRQVAQLPLPTSDPKPSTSGLTTTAVGPEGRFVAAKVYDDSYLAVRRMYLFDLNRIAVAAEPEPAASASGVRVFPLPARANVTVAFASDVPGPVRLRLFDVAGRQVLALDHAGSAGEQRAVLDLSALPAGVYLLRVEAPTRTHTAPVLVR